MLLRPFRPSYRAEHFRVLTPLHLPSLYLPPLHLQPLHLPPLRLPLPRRSEL
tara:strand:+ start:1489 stop:1644 length:156 start_codon:yes stop_codon:yes gene_type:complete